MVAMTWSDDEESGSENEVEPKEVVNLCLMAHEDKDEVSNSNSSQITFNELQDAFDELMAEFKKLGIKNSLLKRWFVLFLKKMKIYKKNKDLKNEVYTLKEKDKENSSSKDFSKKK